jgi:hypothetical protein
MTPRFVHPFCPPLFLPVLNRTRFEPYIDPSPSVASLKMKGISSFTKTNMVKPRGYCRLRQRTMSNDGRTASVNERARTLQICVERLMSVNECLLLIELSTSLDIDAMDAQLGSRNLVGLTTRHCSEYNMFRASYRFFTESRFVEDDGRSSCMKTNVVMQYPRD